jgi:hypothetical protein
MSCNNQTTEKTSDEDPADTLQTVSVEKQKQDIYIKDNSQYDQTFIDGLADYNEPIKLIDNYIVTGKDTTYFPEDLPLNKVTTFKAFKDDKKYELTVTRTNLTNISYNFRLTDKDNKTIDSKAGKAILSSGFFMGPEGDNDIDGGYGSQEYRDNSKDSWLSIRIEIGRAAGGIQRAKIHYGAADKTNNSFNLDLDDRLTLHVTNNSYLDSLRAESKIAYVLFHHQVQKKSIVAIKYQEDWEMDSLFSYIGEANNDTSYLNGGLFNDFGQINLCIDSKISHPIAELHFILEGNCVGFYIQRGNYLKRYAVTAVGRKALLDLYHQFKKEINSDSR